MNIQNPIDRRSMLKGSVLGSAALAEGLFGLMPDPVRAAPQNATPSSTAPSEPKSLDVIVPIKLE